jgi:COP9 signalosome complex subunit 8
VRSLVAEVSISLNRFKRPPARYALARLPDIHANLPLCKLLASLLNVTIHRVHPQVYATATSLVELVSQPEFFHQELALVLTNLTTVFMGSCSCRFIMSVD